jgi:hypothetical protein
MSEQRPLLLVDVDGVLNAFPRDGSVPEGWERTSVTVTGHGRFRITYNPGHGARLRELAAEAGAELAWCSTWEGLANTHIAPLVGLPALPWVPLELGRTGLRFSEYRSVGCVKAIALQAWAGGRPFCWLEDEPDAADELDRLGITNAVVVQVDDSTGLQDMHFDRARAWLEGVRAE